MQAYTVHTQTAEQPEAPSRSGEFAQNIQHGSNEKSLAAQLYPVKTSPRAQTLTMNSEHTEPLQMHADCMYGWLAEMTEKMEAPLGWGILLLLDGVCRDGRQSGFQRDASPTHALHLSAGPSRVREKQINREGPRPLAPGCLKSTHHNASLRSWFGQPG